MTTWSHLLTSNLPEKSTFAALYTTGCATRVPRLKMLSVPDATDNNLDANNIRAAVAKIINPSKIVCDIAATVPGELTNNRKGVSGVR